MPPDADRRPASKLVKSARDPDAAWTKKDGKYAFGYKMHVAMDQGSRIIRRLAFTPANVDDTVPADRLICGDEATVYADKAYDSNARRVRLKEMDIRDGIMRRHNRWLRLGPGPCIVRSYLASTCADRTVVRIAEARLRLWACPLSGTDAQCSGIPGRRDRDQPPAMGTDDAPRRLTDDASSHHGLPTRAT